MRSAFFEFNVAATGLFAARAGMEVVSHNIANSATPGYSRQRSLQRTHIPLTFYDGRGMCGAGAEAYGIGQTRSFYLDKKFWGENRVLGEYSVKDVQLAQIEAILGDKEEYGLTSAFNNFFNSLVDLETNSGDDVYRLGALKISESLALHVGSLGSGLRKHQGDINEEVSATVKSINTLGTQIRDLNEQIFKYESDGSRANDLRDKRILLVDELSRLVNVEVTDGKKFRVYINGYEFVNHLDSTELELIPRAIGAARNIMDVEGLYDMRFIGSAIDFDIYSPTLKGELKGLIDARDGNNGNITVAATNNYKGLPHYMNKLNFLLRAFSLAVNEGKDVNGNVIPNVVGHESGYDRYGNLGEPLFTDGTASANYALMTFQNFSVNPNVVSDPKKIASAIDSISDESDNRVILSFSKINDYDRLFREGKLSDYIIGITSELGIDKKQSNNFKINYHDVISSIDNERISVYGVDINEESVNLVRYNQLYQSAAKLINVIDGIYDTTVNRLGAF
jgi:flagellar hook-associated protein 1 FlgK